MKLGCVHNRLLIGRSHTDIEGSDHPKLVAKELGFIYVDTGAMYRGLAVHFLKKGIVPGEVEKIEAACKDAKVELGYENGVQQVYLNGENITSQLREEAVGNMASVSSAVPAVRAKLLDLQRNLAKEKDVVMDGRDIGTNVLPNADVKVYLTASVECRAMRRFKELEGKGEACDLNRSGGYPGKRRARYDKRDRTT